MDVIRILLADDHPVVRDGIRNRLDREEDLTVVGEAANGEETIRQARRSRPDVVLLDVAMPGPGAVPVMGALRQAVPSVKVLVLSAFDDDEYVFGMLAAGATGYALKDERLSTIVEAVRAVSRGETWLSPRVATKVARRAVGDKAGAEDNPLTDQDQIIRRLAKANSDLAVSRAQEFRLSTIMALIAQGVGMIFVIVFVGVLVGMLIITLTMYTATMERLRDFAILKALGATRWKIWGIVLEQAITGTAVSFGLGLAATLGVDRFVETMSGIRGRYPIPVIVGCFVVMVVLAILGSLISIRKATSVDPVMVFRA